MELFQKYEEYKKKKEAIPIGSIWRDHVGEVEVINVSPRYVLIKNRIESMETEYKEWYPLNSFIHHFEKLYELL